MKKAALVTLVLTLSLLLCIGASAETVTDMMGREVDVPSAQRIISLTPSNTEILYALGLGDKIVGVDTYSNYPEAAMAIEKVGDYYSPNLELITSLKPDLVLAGDKLQVEFVNQLESLGLTVISAEASGYDAITDSITLIAKATGADPATVLEDMAAREKMIFDAVSGVEPLSVYFAVGFGEWGDYSVGPGSYIYEILELLNMAPITSDSPVEWPMYSLEQIIEKNPHVILLSADEALAATFGQQAGYSELPAVKEGRVYAVDPDMVSRPAPRVLIAMARMAEAVYEVDLSDIQ